jgi:hypothetical protein
MIEHFRGARLKIKRANAHLDQLNEVLQGFIQSHFYTLGVEKNPDTGRDDMTYRRIADLPEAVPTIIGDIAHNLRSALDYTLSDIKFTPKRKGKPGDMTVQFPMGKKRDDTVATPSFQAIREAAPLLSDFIVDEIQPYRGGKFLGWEITQLDNRDKHRLLIPTISLTGVTGICAKGQNGTVINGMSITVRDDRVFTPLSTTDRMEITNHGQPTVEILFGKGDVFENEPVIPTLLQCGQLVSNAVDIIEAFRIKNPIV